MSSAARAPRWRPSFKVSPLFSGAGRAGPRRLVIIGAGGICIVVLVAAVVMSGHQLQPFSKDARMASIDALPGGLHSTPEQNALAQQADTAHAHVALAQGNSYTPPLAPSASVVPSPPISAQPAPQQAPPPPRFAARPPPAPIVQVAQPVFPPQVLEPPPPTAATPVDATVQTAPGAVNPQAVAAYSKEIGDLFSQWGGRAPQTTVVLPTTSQPTTQANGQSAPATPSAQAGNTQTPVKPAAAKTQDPATVLIPAGRGIYAHPILALSSDQTSPVVLQADSGPIAGDRMIGSFEKQNDRLVLHISSIIHQGQTIGCDGVVVAPDTMEASVASGVDEHYLARFILPAAAAFIQGLGQALATTSNTVSVLSPLGGATTATNLNFHQQLGVAAGVAAGQVGSVLNQEAPKGPTVTLDANVGVGVMFLSNVKLQPQQ